MTIIVDIKVYDPVKDEFKDYGFSVAPIIEELETDGDDTTHEWYVASGNYSLPVF